MDNKIEEDDKLIAKFMGAKLTGRGGKRVLTLKGKQIFDYHEWATLMPVVEKIESLRNVGEYLKFTVSIEDKESWINCFYDYNGIHKSSIGNIYKYDKWMSGLVENNKLLATYETIIEFIKWYNKEKSNENN